MGSVFKTSELPEYTNQNILKVFKELEKYTVLWKYDGKFDNLPKNVHVRSWMPQSSILGDLFLFLIVSRFSLNQIRQREASAQTLHATFMAYFSGHFVLIDITQCRSLSTRSMREN